MKRMRVIVAMLLAILLLSSVLVAASAESKGYDRWNNPGKGHDWNLEYGNSNANDNTQHNPNGYQNHLPDDQPGPV